MKSKKRHHDSSDESEESDVSAKSSTSSDSESDDSSSSEHRYKKKRKRAESTDSESKSDDQKRSKKRKHKKKKKKHTKKKRRSESIDHVSVDNISISEGEISTKKKRKHKHKHSKRAASSSASEEERHIEHRLHSVVKERRASSEDSQPNRTYYQKEYRRSVSHEDYEREREVQRFYRGSSKEHRSQYQDNKPPGFNYDRDRNERFPTHPVKYDNRGRYFQKPPFIPNNDSYGQRPREYEEYKRPQRFENDEYRRKPREVPYNVREDPRGNNRFNHYEVNKRRDFPENRDFRERRVPELMNLKIFPDKRFPEKFSPDRSRDFRRERQPRDERPLGPPRREPSKSRSPEDRYREKRVAVKEDRDSGKYRDREREDREERDGRGERERQRDRDRDEKRMRERRSEEVRERPMPERRERRSRFDNLDDKKEYSWGKTDVKKEGDKGAGEKEKPNFGLSGKLTADANTVNGVVIKYTEPDDAKQPKRRWRFYPFKGELSLPILYIHRQSCFVIGRDKKVVDIPLEHPSISKQHAALQYRATPFARADGSQGRRVRPYVIDLNSANGTFVNNKKIEPRRYVELLERDVVKFGFSAREYVLLHENSKDDAQDDDQDVPVTTDHIKQEKRVKAEVAADGE